MFVGHSWLFVVCCWLCWGSQHQSRESGADGARLCYAAELAIVLGTLVRSVGSPRAFPRPSKLAHLHIARFVCRLPVMPDVCVHRHRLLTISSAIRYICWSTQHFADFEGRGYISHTSQVLFCHMPPCAQRCNHACDNDTTK